LKGPGLLLNQALINYGLNFLMSKKYTLLQPPFFMTKSKMALTAELADFDDQLYKVSTGVEGDEGYYLIATSEQPISCMHYGEWLEEKALPIRYGGYSSCFRKEAGAHGKDNWGIFRIHQFEKVEQFCITTPEKSWEMHEEMINIDQEFYQSLGIPYRIVAIVSGELNGAAAKKYDLEGWFPGYGTFRELVSCSNCTDFQSRATETRCGIKKQNETEKRYVHMLNATLCATERTLCCILENYQTADGVRVPDVLKPYMGGLEFIPFTRELTKKEQSQH
jgi:seryl-tRNA synthetase